MRLETTARPSILLVRRRQLLSSSSEHDLGFVDKMRRSRAGHIVHSDWHSFESGYKASKRKKGSSTKSRQGGEDMNDRKVVGEKYRRMFVLVDDSGSTRLL